VSSTRKKPVYIRRLEAGLRAEAERRRETPEQSRPHRILNVEWVFVEQNPQSSASVGFLSGSWTKGESYEVVGDEHHSNTYRPEIILYVEDNNGRIHAVHMDHVVRAKGKVRPFCAREETR
jgi:hypothetical protein